MKAQLSPIAVGSIIVVVLAAAAFFFIRGAGDPEPTAKDLPDYSKMTEQEIAQGHQRSSGPPDGGNAGRPR
jgi:hypothetical protein